MISEHDVFNKLTKGHTVVMTALTGSHNYNLNTPDSDKDYKLFVYPTFDDLYGNVTHSNAFQSELIDATCHDVRKLSDLLWKSNINFIEVLFSTRVSFLPEFAWLFDMKDDIASMNLFAFFKATYGTHREKMSKLYKGTSNTQKLVDTFGYDTKQACHALRCLLVLERYAESEDMKKALFLEKTSVDREVLLALKNGEYTVDEFNNMIDVWNTNKLDNIEAWYKQHKAKEDLHKLLDVQIKNIIKTHILDGYND